MADAAEDDDQEEGEATLEQSEAALEQPEAAAEAQQPAAPEVTAPSKRHASKAQQSTAYGMRSSHQPRVFHGSRLFGGARGGYSNKCLASSAAVLPCRHVVEQRPTNLNLQKRS
jgi:hypothetical protein